MDPVWIIIAFICGFAARQLGLPPLVGFLIAGFVLNATGVQGGEFLEGIAEIGITLLLFTIGLKLRIQTLLRPEVWAVASAHMLIIVLLFGFGIYALSVAGLALFASLDFGPSLLIAFALSFSSTVFAVKVLEEKGEMGSMHGRVGIGILIVQDLFAVVFLALSAGKIPSPWALGLLALIPLRPFLMALMDRSGHGELLVLFGLLLAVVGAEGFELVGVKGDLGALILGMLFATHAKAEELAKSLLGFKDLFLVGFFLTIGLSGVPNLETIGVALLLAVVLVVKVALFFALLTRFKLRARSALMASLSLANYGEFGLIVSAIAVSNGWIAGEWLIVIAIALSITFVLASSLNTAAHTIYRRFAQRLKPFETETRLSDEAPISTGPATIAIFGMGRVGTGAYDAMRERHGDTVIGIDFDLQKVKAHQEEGRNIIVGDATDPDFWERVQLSGVLRMVMLTMSNHTANLYAAQRLAEMGYPGVVAATAEFTDQLAELERQGVTAAFNLFDEAGAGFAQHVNAQLKA